MSKNLNVGVVGAGFWADRMLLPAIKSHPKAIIAAICRRNPDRAAEFAHKFGVRAVYSDYREMVDAGGLDALVVSVPDDLHHPITMYALDAGLHVLCEKPLAIDAGQTREMYDKAQAVGVKHMTYFTFRWVPYFSYLKELIDDGYIGCCYSIRASAFATFGRRTNYWWTYDRRRSDGVLSGLGSHLIDLSRWYVGEITNVSAHLGFHIPRKGLGDQPLEPSSDSAALILEFENGAQGQLQCNRVSHLGDRRIEFQVLLHGELGTLEANFTFKGGEIRGARHDENEICRLKIPHRLWGDADRSDPWGVFMTQPVGARLFIDAIIEDQPIASDFFAGWKAQQVVDAARESHAKGIWVAP
jgi:predicted dehydrogenase